MDKFIELNKKELDKALLNLDSDTLQNILNNVPVNSIFEILNEKERFKCLIKKYDFNFIEKILKFIEKKIDQEHYTKNTLNFTKSATHKFIIMLGDKAIQSNISHITKNKYLKLNDLFYKCFQHITYQQFYKHPQHLQQLKKNPKNSLLENLLTFSIKYNFQKYEDFIIRLSHVINNENMKEVLPIILNKKMLNKEQKIEFIGYVFEKIHGLENLQFMIDKYDPEIRATFHKKIDKHLFWDDFSVENNYRNYFHANLISDFQIEKLIFLEKKSIRLYPI